MDEVWRIASKNALYDEEIRIVSLMHDFGKYTTYFQEYLEDENESILSRHGFISAIAASYISLKTGREINSALTVYSCVLRHHGNLKNVGHDLPQRRGMVSQLYDYELLFKVKNAYEQMDDMKKNIDFICKDYHGFGYEQLIRDFITSGDIENILVELKKAELKKKPDYLMHQYIYSRLIYADKLSASNTTIPAEKYVSFNILNNEREKLCSSKKQIDAIRTNIFNSVQNTLLSSYSSSNIYTITAPTGTGKTFSGFFAALKLKEMNNMTGKIIYTLPFTSIINQNYNSLLKLFSGSGAIDDRYILMHHHLGDISYTQQHSEAENYSVMQSKLLIETWCSGVIVTTFVQLMETLLGTRNKMLKKFHCLENSIILIDEIQSLDIHYHKIIEELITHTINRFNCKVILMTATKPVIFQGAKELLPNYKDYYRMFNRTRMLIDMDPKTCDEFVSAFVELYDENKSYLIVCNTIRQSLDIYSKLCKSNILDNEILYYLSTNIIPKHREKVISDVNKVLKNSNNLKKPILISTQVVEAGVDFDFDEVYRDMAPLDSIIQCAGRCNRNNRDTKSFTFGNVHIVNMVHENRPDSYASFVYRQNWLNITVELLKSKLEIEEHDYLDLIDKYFESIKQCTSDVEYEKYRKAIEQLDFDTISEFSLINDKNGYIDAFIIADDESENVFSLFNQAVSLKNVSQRQEKILVIRKEVLQNSISVPFKYKGKFEANPHMFFLPREACGDNGLYSMETGFRRVEEFDQFF